MENLLLKKEDALMGGATLKSVAELVIRPRRRGLSRLCVSLHDTSDGSVEKLQ